MPEGVQANILGVQGPAVATSPLAVEQRTVSAPQQAPNRLLDFMASTSQLVQQKLAQKQFQENQRVLAEEQAAQEQEITQRVAHLRTATERGRRAFAEAVRNGDKLLGENPYVQRAVTLRGYTNVADAVMRDMRAAYGNSEIEGESPSVVAEWAQEFVREQALELGIDLEDPLVVEAFNTRVNQQTEAFLNLSTNQYIERTGAEYRRDYTRSVGNSLDLNGYTIRGGEDNEDFGVGVATIAGEIQQRMDEARKNGVGNADLIALTLDGLRETAQRHALDLYQATPGENGENPVEQQITETFDGLRDGLPEIIASLTDSNGNPLSQDPDAIKALNDFQGRLDQMENSVRTTHQRNRTAAKRAETEALTNFFHKITSTGNPAESFRTMQQWVTENPDQDTTENWDRYNEAMKVREQSRSFVKDYNPYDDIQQNAMFNTWASLDTYQDRQAYFEQNQVPPAVRREFAQREAAGNTTIGASAQKAQAEVARRFRSDIDDIIGDPTLSEKAYAIMMEAYNTPTRNFQLMGNDAFDKNIVGQPLGESGKVMSLVEAEKIRLEAHYLGIEKAQEALQRFTSMGVEEQTTMGVTEAATFGSEELQKGLQEEAATARQEEQQRAQMLEAAEAQQREAVDKALGQMSTLPALAEVDLRQLGATFGRDNNLAVEMDQNTKTLLGAIPGADVDGVPKETIRKEYQRIIMMASEGSDAVDTPIVITKEMAPLLEAHGVHIFEMTPPEYLALLNKILRNRLGDASLEEAPTELPEPIVPPIPVAKVEE